ncbi:MAG TPA: hypothetical protein VFQ61_06325 [Polyangiaceae bacterium]|nr:hypothetical protein [Polyangiaceae bacterium]
MASPKTLTGTPVFSATVLAPGQGEKGNEDTFKRALQTLINNDVALKAGLGSGTGEGGITTVFSLLADGLVPHPGAEFSGSNAFLRYDGTWAPPIEPATQGSIAVSSTDRYVPFAGARFSGTQDHWDLLATNSTGDQEIFSFDTTAGSSDARLGHSSLATLELAAKTAILTAGLALKGTHTDTAVPASVTVYNPAAWRTATLARLASAAGGSSIAGFGGGYVVGAASVKVLVNVSVGFNLTILHNAGGAGSDRVVTSTGQALVLGPGESCLLVYDEPLSHWRAFPLVGGSAAAENPSFTDVLASGSSFGGVFDFIHAGNTQGIQALSEASSGNAFGLSFSAQSSDAAHNGEGGKVEIRAGAGGGNREGGFAIVSAGDGGATGAGGQIHLIAGLANAGTGERADINVFGSRIGNLGEPYAPSHAANKAYVDARSPIASPVRVTPAESPYAAAHGAFVLLVRTALGAVTIDLPQPPEAGDRYIIKDVDGQAAAHPITINHAGLLSDAALSATVIALPWQSAEIVFESLVAKYLVLSEANAESTSGSSPSLFSSSAPGIVPASGGGAETYLRADGVWAVPVGTGGEGGTVGLFDDTHSGIVPASGGGGAKFLRADRTWMEPPVFSLLNAGYVPASSGDPATFLRADGTWAVPAGSGGLADNSVTLAKLEDIASGRLLGRWSAGTGDPEAITLGGGLEFTGGGALQRTALTGDVTAAAGNSATSIAANAVTSGKILDGAVGTTKIADLGVTTQKLADDAVTFAKLQNLATDRLVGRDTTGTGDAESLTVGGGIEFTGAGGIQRSALTGAVTAAAGSNTTSISAGAVLSTHIGAGAVLFGNIQSINTDKLVGRDTAGTGVVEEIGLTGGLEFTGTSNIQISAKGVTDAKLRDSAACSVIGRSANTVGSPADITATVDDRFLGRQGGTLGYYQVTTGCIGNDQVTFAKVQNISPGVLLGRSSSFGTGAGDIQEISLGASLGLEGGQLAVTGLGLSQVMSVSPTTPGTGGSLAIVYSDAIEFWGSEAESYTHESSWLRREDGFLLLSASDALSASGASGGNLILRPGAGDGAGFQGYISVENAKIRNVGSPAAGTDATNKTYVDGRTLGDVLTASPSGAGGARIPNVGTPTATTDAATKAYVDGKLPTFTAAGQVPVYDGADLVASGVKTATIADADVATFNPGAASRFVIPTTTANRTITLVSTGMSSLIDSGKDWICTFERQNTSAFTVTLVWGSNSWVFPASAPDKLFMQIGWDGTNFFKCGAGALV